MFLEIQEILDLVTLILSASKDNPPKPVKKMTNRPSEELLNELEDSILDEEINDLFISGDTNKKTIH